MPPPTFKAPQPIPASAGIGLRGEHYEAALADAARVGWMEVHTENYFGRGGVPHRYLRDIREHCPISFHGVGLSLGSTDPLDRAHLQRIRELVREYRPGLVSEHLSWSSVGGVFTNDLLPLPLTGESLDHFARRVDQVQEYLKRSILVENPSTYLRFAGRSLRESDFLNTLAERTGCGLLLDVNNVYVCASNHGFDARRYLDSIEPAHVGEIHLAGHTRNEFEDGDILIDTHNREVCEPVWRLYEHALSRTGAKPTLIEWDTDLPSFDVLLAQAARAQTILDRRHAAAA